MLAKCFLLCQCVFSYHLFIAYMLFQMAAAKNFTVICIAFCMTVIALGKVDNGFHIFR